MPSFGEPSEENSGAMRYIELHASKHVSWFVTVLYGLLLKLSQEGDVESEEKSERYLTMPTCSTFVIKKKSEHILLILTPGLLT